MQHFRFNGFIIALAFAGLLGLESCSSETGSMSEGIIEYKATPVDPASTMASIAPSKMTVKFKDDYSNAEMVAGLGMASMSFISDPKKSEFTSMVNLIGQKYYSIMKKDEVVKNNHFLPEYEVEETKERKIIAGYNCTKAIIRFKDTSNKPIEVWFTREIHFKNPNWSNVYYKVDGVLMDYTLKKFGLELHFVASSVNSAKIDENTFQLLPEYKKISNEALEAMFKEME